MASTVTTVDGSQIRFPAEDIVLFVSTTSYNSLTMPTGSSDLAINSLSRKNPVTKCRVNHTMVSQTVLIEVWLLDIDETPEGYVMLRQFSYSKLPFSV